MASGGTGTVYRAYDLRLQKTWAAKKVGQDFPIREEFTMGKLMDAAFPGIVDVVEQEDARFLIMEWIEGETLAAQIERDGAFVEKTAIEIGICLAKAIQKLHQMQPPLLYLDCKPSNVMKDSNGKIRLIDFGSALEAHTPVTKGISASPGYAAPEQLSREIEKRCVDVRTDVFGLGRTLYALLCGADLSRPPYAFASLKSRCPQVSAGMEQIVERATAKNPEDRFQTMDALLQALIQLQTASSTEAAGKKKPFWEKIRRRKTVDCEVLQSVLRTEKPPGRWMFVLLAVILMLHGTTAAAEASAGQTTTASATAAVHAAVRSVPVTLRDSSLRKLLLKENTTLYSEKPVFLELDPKKLGMELETGDEVRVVLSIYGGAEKIGEYEFMVGREH